MKTCDIAIVGAGIIGLSLAHSCARQNWNTLVLEKTSRAGGILHSHSAAPNGDFWLELGAHTCYNSYRGLIDLIEECNLVEHMQRREKVPFKLLVDGKIASIPSQLSFVELLFSAPRIFFLKKAGRSVASYYGKIVGKGNFARVFSAVFSAVPSQNADDFPADMLFKKRRRRKDIMKSFTMRDGLQCIAEALAETPGVQLLRDCDVTCIAWEAGTFQIATAAGDSFQSKALALAAPAAGAARLLQPNFPEIAAHLDKIEVLEVETLGVAVEKSALSFDFIAGAIPLDDAFYSIVSRDTVPHATYRGFTFHFKPGRLDRQAKLKRIGAILGVDPDGLKHICEKTNCVPSLKLGHAEWVHSIDTALAGKPLLLTGNYFLGLSIEDCISRSRSEFQRLQEILK